MTVTPEAEAVYAAELDAQEDLGWESSEPLALDDVAEFLRGVVVQLGYDADAAPHVVYDVPDDHELTGWVRDGTIHLHPRLVDRWVVLHELAHVLRHDGHGPQFCAVYVDAVRAGIGDEAADALLAAFDEYEIAVDPNWMRVPRRSAFADGLQTSSGSDPNA